MGPRDAAIGHWIDQLEEGREKLSELWRQASRRGFFARTVTWLHLSRDKEVRAIREAVKTLSEGLAPLVNMAEVAAPNIGTQPQLHALRIARAAKTRLGTAEREARRALELEGRRRRKERLEALREATTLGRWAALDAMQILRMAVKEGTSPIETPPEQPSLIEHQEEDMDLRPSS